MKTITLKAGEIIKQDGIPMRLSGDTQVECATDLTKCPRCGGPADNGHDREFPPNPYLCTRCHKAAEADSRVYEG